MSGKKATGKTIRGVEKLTGIPKRNMNLSNILDESYRAAFGLEDVGQVTYTFEPKDSDRDTLIVPQTLSMTIPGENASFDSAGEYFRSGIDC